MVSGEASPNSREGGSAHDPAQIETLPDLAAGLNALRHGGSDAELARAAGGRAEVLPPSTLSDMLNGKSVPSKDTVVKFLAACGLTGAKQQPWLAAWERVATSHLRRPTGAISSRYAELALLYRRLADAGDGSAADRFADLLAGQTGIDELWQRADAGDRYAADRLADLLAGQTGIDELWQRADAGDGSAAVRLADLLAKYGRVDEAIAVRRQHAAAGDRYAAAYWLPDLLAKHGRVDALRQLVDAGDGSAAGRLADLLVRRDRVDEAIAVLRQCADAGDEYAAGGLVRLLAEHGRVDELRQRADAGDESAAVWLAGLLVRQNRVDELRRRADAGDKYAAGRLAGLLTDDQMAELLVRPDHVHEAIAALQQHAVVISAQSAARWLADLLAEHGRVDEAIAVLRQRADADGGDGSAARWLAVLLTEHGHVDELRQRADTGDSHAASRLADRLVRRDRVDEAIGVLRQCANAGGGSAADQLAILLAKHGRADEAITVLRQRADADGYAAYWLASLLAEHGRVDELRQRADAGDRQAAERLANLLARQAKAAEDAYHAMIARLVKQADIDTLRRVARYDDVFTLRQLAPLYLNQGHGQDSDACVVLESLLYGTEAASLIPQAAEFPAEVRARVLYDGIEELDSQAHPLPSAPSPDWFEIEWVRWVVVAIGSGVLGNAAYQAIGKAVTHIWKLRHRGREPSHAAEPAAEPSARLAPIQRTFQQALQLAFIAVHDHCLSVAVEVPDFKQINYSVLTTPDGRWIFTIRPDDRRTFTVRVPPLHDDETRIVITMYVKSVRHRSRRKW